MDSPLWRTILVAIAVAIALSLAGSVTSATAQETPSTAVPTPNIIPRPNSGHAPADAGDRGGRLQLGVLAVVVLGVGGAAVHITRQSRRARPWPR